MHSTSYTGTVSDDTQSPRIFEFEFRGVTVEVNYTATSKLYPESVPRDWCQCVECTNFRLAKREFFPNDTESMLAHAFGVDPMQPVSSQTGRDNRRQYGYTRTVGYYVVIGQLKGAERSGRWYDPERAHSFIWAESAKLEEYRESVAFGSSPVEPYFLVRFSLLMPWLPEFLLLMAEEQFPAEWFSQFTRRRRLYWEKQNGFSETNRPRSAGGVTVYAA
jgi:hypothetical protein